VIQVEYAVDEQPSARYCLLNASIGVTAEANAFFNSRSRFIRGLQRVSVDLAIFVTACAACSCIATSHASSRSRRAGEELAITNLGVLKRPNFAGSSDDQPSPVKLDMKHCWTCTGADYGWNHMAIRRQGTMFEVWMGTAGNVALQGFYDYPKAVDSQHVRVGVHHGNFEWRGDSAYAYFRILDVEIPVRKGMKIGYWIYHAQGTPKIALDGHFTDGNTFRDFNNRYSHAIGKVIVVSARSLSIEIDEHETIEGHGGHVGWD
jgi:hypothetical protein